MSWKNVKIGDFLKRSKIPIDIEDNQSYKRVTIRTKHQGVSVRDTESGKKIGTKKQFLLKKGQFVLSKIDARYGAFGIAPDEVDGSIITGNFWAYDVDNSIMNIDWFHQYTNSPIFYDLCERASSGITHRKYLDEDFFLNYSLSIPDVSEQDGHVIFIEDRKSRIGNLENEQVHQLELLKRLRQQVLHDAVQGKLVPKNLNDESASVLLERIKAEKEKLVREGNIKKEKPLPEIKQEEIPFEIPDNWIWCRLGEITKQITDGEHQTPPKLSQGRLLLSAKNIRDGFIDFSDADYISEKDYKKSVSRCNPQMGDVLIVSVGATIGRSAILSTKDEFAIVRSVALIKPSTLINNKFIKIVLDSPLLQNDIKSRKWGTAQPCLYLNQIKELSVPLPPLGEQSRITEKIEQLLTLCDELEQSVNQNQRYLKDLLWVAFKEALVPKNK